MPPNNTHYLSRKAEQAVGWPKACVLGVDEAGRGAWAGPVVAAAIYLPPDFAVHGIFDSKQLTIKNREAAFARLCALPHGVGVASVAEIDAHNVLAATMLAMWRAVDKFPTTAAHILVDGNHLPDWPYAASALVKGDSKSPAIAAASILAKVTRDRLMTRLDGRFSGYGWHKNKGYGTQIHAEGLKKQGVTPHHRHSFAPIAKLVGKMTQSACG